MWNELKVRGKGTQGELQNWKIFWKEGSCGNKNREPDKVADISVVSVEINGLNI